MELTMSHFTNLTVPEPKGECEFVGEFAKMLPIVNFLSLADQPQEDRLQLLEMAELSVRGDLQERQRTQGMLMAYTGKWVHACTQKPSTDLISLIVNAKIDGESISPERMSDMMIVVLFGGLDTVAAMMSLICRFLAEHPTERRHLAEEPELILMAIDEMIGRHGVSTARVVVEGMDFKGIHLKPGEQIQVPNALFGLDDRRFVIGWKLISGESPSYTRHLATARTVARVLSLRAPRSRCYCRNGSRGFPNSRSRLLSSRAVRQAW